MDFGLSGEQRLLQQTVRDFLAREYPPEKRREVFDAGTPLLPGFERSQSFVF